MIAVASRTHELRRRRGDPTLWVLRLDRNPVDSLSPRSGGRLHDFHPRQTSFEVFTEFPPVPFIIDAWPFDLPVREWAILSRFIIIMKRAEWSFFHRCSIGVIGLCRFWPPQGNPKISLSLRRPAGWLERWVRLVYHISSVAGGGVGGAVVMVVVGLIKKSMGKS